MNLIEALPTDPLVSRYVDRYQFFIMEGPSFFKTIPNGRIEAYLIFKGGFSIWDDNKEQFGKVKQAGILPATSRPALIKIGSELVCFNIKLKLNSLALPELQGFYTEISKINSEFLYPEHLRSELINRVYLNGDNLNTDLIDEMIKPIFENITEDQAITRILSEMKNNEHSGIENIAESLNMSSKTLCRVIKKYFNFTPKTLLGILRFEETTAYLKRNDTEKLIEAISFGYYDQSHFIKECRKISGTTPTNLFSKMALPTNDLMVGARAFDLSEL